MAKNKIKRNLDWRVDKSKAKRKEMAGQDGFKT